MKHFQKISILFVCIAFLSSSTSEIEMNGDYYGIVIGQSKLKGIKMIFGNKYKIEKRNISIRFIGSESRNLLNTRIIYKKKGITFDFIGGDIKNETVSRIIFSNPYKGKTTKGISIGKSKVDDVIKTYGNGYWNTSGFFNKYLHLSYDSISFVFNEKISSDKLKEINKNEFKNLKVYQIILTQ